MISAEIGEIRREDLRASEAWVSQELLDHIAVTVEIAEWTWRVDLEGRFICACWVVTDAPRPGRGGWVQMLFGRAADEMKTTSWGPSALRYWRRVRDLMRYERLRCWVSCDDTRAIRFAEAMDFAYDAGPATAYMPDGSDGQLMLWRRGNAGIGT